MLTATRRGVKIYFLYDEIGSRRLGEPYRSELMAAGIRTPRLPSPGYIR